MNKKEKKCCDECKIHISCGIEGDVRDGFGICTCKGNGCYDKNCECHKSPKPEKKATRKGVRIEEIDICDHDDSNPYLQQAPEGTGQRLKAMQQGIDYCLKCRNFYKVNSR